jgi:hypothetical protein
MCPSDSGDWLPGYDPFGAAMAVCVTVFIMSLLGLWTIYSTSVNTLIGTARQRRWARARTRTRAFGGQP